MQANIIMEDVICCCFIELFLMVANLKQMLAKAQLNHHIIALHLQYSQQGRSQRGEGGRQIWEDNLENAAKKLKKIRPKRGYSGRKGKHCDAFPCGRV